MATATERVYHPIANIFPVIDGSDLEALRESIRAHGVQVPIVVWRGQIVDGRHRALIADQLGVECPSREFDGDEDAMFAHVMALNLRRRHLTSTQVAAVLAMADKLREAARTATGGRGRPTGADRPAAGRAVEEIAAKHGTSPAQLKRAAKIARERPDLAERMARGELQLRQAMVAAKLQETDPDLAEQVLEGEIGPVEAERLAKERAPVDDSTEGRMKTWNAAIESWAKEVVRCGDNGPDGVPPQSLAVIRDRLKAVAGSIRAQKGAGVCPKCGGEGCARCYGRGWMDKVSLDSAAAKGK